MLIKQFGIIFHKFTKKEILHVYTGGHFVVVILVNNKKYTFNSSVNFEIVSKDDSDV